MGTSKNWESFRKRQVVQQQIRADRDSLVPARPGKVFKAKYNGTECIRCHTPIYKGSEMMRYLDGWAHRGCTR